MIKPTRRSILASVGLLATLGVIGIAAAIAAGVEIYLPITRVHFKCRFADGSYTEYKEREKWYFYAEPFPHAQTYAYLGSSMKYVDAKGRKHQHVGTENARCIGVGKRDGRIFWDDGFENLKGEFVHFTEVLNQKGVVPPRWENVPKEIPVTPDQTPEIRRFMAKEFLYGGYRAHVLPLNSDETLLFEQPLTSLKHPTAPSGTVLYVYQSTSTDYGKTWSAPVITKDAKLFEIGRLLTKQSWSATVDTIVVDRSVR